ncbi:aspartate dehydrogenase domain-containing protein [Arthrobacter sp. UCD-GKA]|uniref:aspartate dehydrogenase domain-containing protein n=1 Tax=Arthrobacter sp. UCD-GKA TaxID=1913576 RepID=UPI00158736F2|nr:aspartate dehydrogenase domain-containing protein [Arthrobacter sp. UCD-GKA]
MGIDVVLLGYGAIGQAVHRMLGAHDGEVRVLGVLDRASLADPDPATPAARTTGPAEPGSAPRLPVLDLATAIERADLVIECASPAAVRAHGPAITGAGTDLLVASLGALVDGPLRTALEAGPGRCHYSTGAIGGLDLIRASAGTINAIELRTRKLPEALLHPGLPGTLRSAIARAAESGTAARVFSGSVAEAIRDFPSNINVAAALGLAAGDLDLVAVDIVADPAAAMTSHDITVRGSGGNYRFAIENFPDPANPATSALTARSMASGVLRLAGRGPHFI